MVVVTIFVAKNNSHGCRWEIFGMFAYCGLVVEIQPLDCHNLGTFAPLPTSTNKFCRVVSSTTPDAF